MSGRLRRPSFAPCFLALLFLVLAPAALDTGPRSPTAGSAETAVANALGPSFESALVAKSGIQPGDGGQGRTLPGSLLFVLGSLALLACRPARTGPAPVRRFLRSLPPPAPTGPRAPPVLRLP